MKVAIDLECLLRQDTAYGPDQLPDPLPGVRFALEQAMERDFVRPVIVTSRLNRPTDAEFAAMGSVPKPEDEWRKMMAERIYGHLVEVHGFPRSIDIWDRPGIPTVDAWVVPRNGAVMPVDLDDDETGPAMSACIRLIRAAHLRAGDGKVLCDDGGEVLPDASFEDEGGDPHDERLSDTLNDLLAELASNSLPLRTVADEPGRFIEEHVWEDVARAHVELFGDESPFREDEIEEEQEAADDAIEDARARRELPWT